MSLAIVFTAVAVCWAASIVIAVWLAATEALAWERHRVSVAVSLGQLADRQAKREAAAAPPPPGYGAAGRLAIAPRHAAGTRPRANLRPVVIPPQPAPDPRMHTGQLTALTGTGEMRAVTDQFIHEMRHRENAWRRQQEASTL